MQLQEISPSSLPNRKLPENNNINSSNNSEGECGKPEPSSDSSSGSASDALVLRNAQNLYMVRKWFYDNTLVQITKNTLQNHRTRVDLVRTDKQQYVLKTTQVDLGKREYIVLGHLRDVSFVPKLLSKPIHRGENITLAMSWCQGVHPCTFTTQSELQAFMKALLIVSVVKFKVIIAKQIYIRRCNRSTDTISSTTILKNTTSCGITRQTLFI